MSDPDPLINAVKRAQRFSKPSLPSLPPQWGRWAGFALSSGFLVFLVLFVWVFCRIEPGSGEIAILIHKNGDDLPPGAIIALQPQQKGIQFEVLPEGRYFRNPYIWGWEIGRSPIFQRASWLY